MDCDIEAVGEIGDIPAFVRARLDQRARNPDVDNNGNPFARPYPDRPWVDRGLPERSRAR